MQRRMKLGGTELTLDSTVAELCATPVGHDVVSKLLLQTGLSQSLMKNQLIGGRRLKTLVKLSGGKVTEELLQTLLDLVNTEKDRPGDGTGDVTPAWWKEAVFYQIYPRSFYDANGDGIGDLRGIMEKLDDLAALGVDALWLSPIYDSPNDDNGYDIRDYRKIMAEFGTMEDFEQLLARVHEKGMKLIMDLVVNHTSDEHPWFQTALAYPTSKYRDYYFFRDDVDGQAPNNWTSYFSGSAWNHYENKHLWGLHLFSQKQMDLNWDNAAVRADIADMVSWWLDKGVDGFRMDVINYISKEEGLPDGSPAIGELMGYTGVEHYYYGPHLHTYLHELNKNAFAPHGAFSVGETPGVGIEMAKLLTGEESEELDMIFSFDQLESPGHTRFDDYRYDLNYYRDYITDWMLHYGNNCWMSLFYNNHDNPRMASKVDPRPAYRRQVQILLAVMQFTLKGTPFVFQGDEMGLVNYDFRSIGDIGDIESVNLYEELTAQKKQSPGEAFRTILAGTRDHARVLLPWNRKTDGSAIPRDPHLPAFLYQEPDPQITKIYRQLIRFRKKHPETLIYGTFTPLIDKKNIFVYKRSGGGETFVIECNLSDKPLVTGFTPKGYHPVFPKPSEEERKANGGRISMKLEAYGARIWRKNHEEGRQ